MNDEKKKLKPGDIVMDCIIIGVLLVVVIVVGTTIYNRGKSTDDSSTKIAKTITPNPEKKEGGVKTYSCVISATGSNDTVFRIAFNANDMTYAESIYAGNQSTTLDAGSYEKEENKYVVTSAKGKAKQIYVEDGEYLVAQSALFTGKVPETDTFEGSFVYEVKGQSKTTITFKEDGTYEQTLLSYAKKENSGEDKDSTQTTTGKYTRKGNFIHREPDNKDSLMDLYVYDGQLCNGYYKQEK